MNPLMKFLKFFAKTENLAILAALVYIYIVALKPGFAVVFLFMALAMLTAGGVLIAALLSAVIREQQRKAVALLAGAVVFNALSVIMTMCDLGWPQYAVNWDQMIYYLENGRTSLKVVMGGFTLAQIGMLGWSFWLLRRARLNPVYGPDDFDWSVPSGVCRDKLPK